MSFASRLLLFFYSSRYRRLQVIHALPRPVVDGCLRANPAVGGSESRFFTQIKLGQSLGRRPPAEEKWRDLPRIGRPEALREWNRFRRTWKKQKPLLSVPGADVKREGKELTSRTMELKSESASNAGNSFKRDRNRGNPDPISPMFGISVNFM